jgi:hypothetical protein
MHDFICACAFIAIVALPACIAMFSATDTDLTDELPPQNLPAR